MCSCLRSVLAHRRRRWGTLATWSVVVLALGCDDDVAGPPIAPSNAIPIQFRSSVGREVFNEDLDLITAWLEGRTLRVAVEKTQGSMLDLSVITAARFEATSVPTLSLWFRRDAPDVVGFTVADTVDVDLTPILFLRIVRQLDEPWRLRLVSRTGIGYQSLYLPIPATRHEPQSPADSEAENIALWLGDSLFASPGLVAVVQAELAVLRAQWTDSIPALESIRFVPPASAGELLAYISGSLVTSIVQGDYLGWDAIDTTMHLREWRITDFGTRMIYFRFERRFHPGRMLESTPELPGMSCLQANLNWSFYRRWVYPRPHASGRSYLFDYGWGDCPSGCITKRSLYFEPDGDRFRLVGDWTRSAPEPEPPAWWSEASLNRALWTEWQSCCNTCGELNGRHDAESGQP